VSSGVQKIGDIGKGINYTSTETLTTGTITKSFAQNNPTLMKVITIASGGLSGGFSSAIAGGNFWQGAKQGLIVAGLNHTAHDVVEELSNSKPRILGKMRDEIKNANLDPALVESALMGNKDAIIQIIAKLPTLNDLYNNVLNGDYKLNVECDNHGWTLGTDANGKTVIKSVALGAVKDGTIYLYEMAFKNFDTLIGTIAHEGYHYYNARFERSSWVQNLTHRKNIDEYTAYQFDYKYTGDIESFNQMNHHKNLIPSKYLPK
jgi:hypothetical protein